MDTNTPGSVDRAPKPWHFEKREIFFNGKFPYDEATGRDVLDR